MVSRATQREADPSSPAVLAIWVQETAEGARTVPKAFVASFGGSTQYSREAGNCFP